MGELELLSGSTDGSETAVGQRPKVGNVSRYSRWLEARIQFPAIDRGSVPIMRAHLGFARGVTEDRRISNGEVTARRGLWL